MRHGNQLPPDLYAPLVLSDGAQAGARIVAANEAAEAQDLYAGMPITDARAIYPALLVIPADPDGDVQALEQLALWGQRYTPFIRPDPPDGLILDLTGCAHLFGGEPRLAADLTQRLDTFGLSARLAIASTIGASWAAARHAPHSVTIVTDDMSISQTLAHCPMAALRLDDETIAALAKVGLKQIGDLLNKPRAPLAARFGMKLIQRLDQALGYDDESLNPMSPPPLYRAACQFIEPIITLSSIEEAARHLTAQLAEQLFKAGKGARQIELALFRVDGWFKTVQLRTSTLSHDATHLARLLCERLEGIEAHAGFGFEAAALSAHSVENITARQHDFAGEHPAALETEDLTQLLDRFVNRFGADSVTRFVPQQSYLPERALAAVSVLKANAPHDWSEHHQTFMGGAAYARPLLLFPRPEPISVLVEMPDKPPVRFEWRRKAHRVVRADGPERIAPEWWRNSKTRQQTRDYYRVEDDAGHRFWLYRDGLYKRKNDMPAWFIHGVFS